jgi:hypothetical protein
MARRAAVAVLIVATAWPAAAGGPPPGGDARGDEAAIRAMEEEERVAVLKNDHAFVMGGETVRPTGVAPNAGKTVTRRFTNVWRREGGAWRSFACHASIVGVVQ